MSLDVKLTAKCLYSGIHFLEPTENSNQFLFPLALISVDNREGIHIIFIHEASVSCHHVMPSV